MDSSITLVVSNGAVVLVLSLNPLYDMITSIQRKERYVVVRNGLGIL